MRIAIPVREQSLVQEYKDILFKFRARLPAFWRYFFALLAMRAINFSSLLPWKKFMREVRIALISGSEIWPSSFAICTAMAASIAAIESLS